MILPNENISIMLVHNTLGHPSYDLGTLCSAGEKYINMWSKHKPVVHDCFGSGLMSYPSDWYKGEGTSGIIYTIYDTLELLEDSVKKGVKQFSYQPPKGGASSPYRLGDFRLYSTEARPPILASQVIDKVFIKDKTVRFNLIANTDTTYSLSVKDIFEGFFRSNVYYGVAFKRSGWNDGKWTWMTVPFVEGNMTELLLPISSGFDEGTYSVIQFLTHNHSDYPTPSQCMSCIAIPTAGESLLQSIELKKEPTYGDLKFSVNIDAYFVKIAPELSDEVDYSKVYYKISFQSRNGIVQRPTNVSVILAENQMGVPQHSSEKLGAFDIPGTGVKTFKGSLLNGTRGNTGHYDQFPVIVVQGDYEGRFGLTFGFKTVLEVRDN